MASYNDDFIVKNGLIVRAANLANYISTSTTTGAIVTPGGVGIGGDANIGGKLTVNTTASLAALAVTDITKILSTAVNTSTIVPDGNALQVGGGIFASNINISGIGLIKGSRILTVAEGFTGGVISDPLVINTTTNSTSTTTGALSTPGGIGVGRDMHIGGSVWTSGTTYVSGDMYGSGQHVLTTIQYNGNSFISAKAVQNGYTTTVTLTNTGVTTIAAGTGISIDRGTGTVTVTNAGVTSIAAGGNEINVSAATGDITLTVQSTLQDVALRGSYTDQAIQINNTTDVVNTLTGNALDVLGSIGAKRINVANTSYVNGAQIVTTGTINQYIGGTITQPLRIANTTSSINTQTGALVVDGGVGIGENLNVGKNFAVNGNATIYGGLTVVGSYTTVLVNSTQTVFSDAAIELGAGFDDGPLSINDGLDRGLILSYNTGSSVAFYNHSFLGRQAQTGELVFLNNVTTSSSWVPDNPFNGTWGTARLGALRLVNGTLSTGTQSGDLTVVGGIGVGGNIYANAVYDLGARVITTVNVTTGTNSGLIVTQNTQSGTLLTIGLTNTGVLSLGAGNGSIQISTSTGDVLVYNAGVTDIGAQSGIYSDLTFSYANTRLGANPNSGSVLIGNNSTLETVTTRGNTTSNIIKILNQTTSTTDTATNALQVLGGISAKTLLITDKGFINNAEIVTSATINAFSGGTINNNLKINSNVTSTSTNSGALTVTGGVGIGDNLNVWNNITVWNTSTSSALTVFGPSEFQKTLHANTVSALVLGLDLVSVGTGTVNINGIDILKYDASTWYVSDNGSDTNDGRRVQSAFATIKHALTVAQSGDIVNIESGTYTEVFPLTIPQGVSVRGAGLRTTVIQPTVGTKNLDCFYMNGETTISDLTIANFLKPGYAFKFANGAKITTKSPYVERVSVITKGTVTSSTDPYGFGSNDAGNGAYLDGSVLDPTSLEPAMLWNEVTFIVPNATGWYMTNGVRAELLNGFSYFADKAINAVAGTTGLGNTGTTRLKLQNVTGIFKTGETITYKDPNNNILASGTISSTASGYVHILGPSYGFETITDRAGKTITTYGDAVQSTTQKKFGVSSGKFDGSGDYLEVLNDSDFQFGTGDFTVEGWIYLSSLGKIHRIFYKGTNSASSIRASVNSSNVLSAIWAGTTIAGTTTLTTGQWYHVALSRQGSSNTIKLYLNGTLEASSTSATGNANNTDPVSIGGIAGTAADSVDGYLDGIRVSNNYRYSSAFTAPTSELTSDANTILLLNMNQGNGVTGFIDSAQGTQNVYSSGGATSTRIALADYHQFGAELRCIGSAAVFGNSGVTANGTGTDLKLIAFNMSHIGAGGDLSDDISLVNQAAEVIQLNNGKIYFQTVDQSGDFRVGSSFVVNQRTGNVSFGNAQVNLAGLNQLTITDGTNNATILPTSISVGNLSLAGNTIVSLSGDITLDPAGTLTTINSDLAVNGQFSVLTLGVPGLTQSTSTTTGALTIGGGAGIGGNVNIGGTFTSIVTASSTSTIANNAIQAINGGIGAQTLYIAQTGWINGNQIVTTASIGQSLGGNVPNAIHITNTATNNANTQSGALIVDGGAAIAGDLTIGGNLNLLGGGSVLTNITATTDAYIGASVTKSGTTATINIVNLGVQSLTAGSGISVSASTGTVTVSSTDTLQDVTSRGATTNVALSITSAAANTTTVANNALSVTGGIGADSIYIARFGWLAGSEIVTTATLGNAFNSSTQVTGQFNITNTSSNAFYVAGGGTVGGNFTIGGDLNVQGTVTYLNSTNIDVGNKVIFLSTLTGSAALSAGSGIIVGKDDNNTNTDWATWTFDGGTPGNWQSGNGIIPLRNDLELGTALSEWWKAIRAKDAYFDTVTSTATVYSTSTIAGNTLMTQGGIAGKTLYLTQDGWIGTARIITTDNLATYASTFDGGTIHNDLIQLSTTNAASTITGAVQVRGGAGIGYDLRVGRTVYASDLNITNTGLIQSVNTATAVNSAAFVVNGGVGIGQNLRVNTRADIGDILTVGSDLYASGKIIFKPGISYIVNDASGNENIVAANLQLTGTGTVIIQSSLGNVINGYTTVTNKLDVTGLVSLTQGGILDLQVAGGATFGGATYINSTTSITSNESSTSTIANNALAVTGGVGARTLYLSESGWINGSQIITTSTLNSFTGGAINNSLHITNTTDATSTITGALVVDGGVGIGKNLFVGGNTYLQGDLFIDGASFMLSSNTIQTGDKLIYVSTGATSSLLATNSGIGVGPVGSAYATWLYDNATTSWKSSVSLTGNTSVGLGTSGSPWGSAYVNAVYVRNNQTSTNTTTGALQVLGGIAASENLYLGSSRGNTTTAINNALTTVGGAYIGGTLNVAGASAWVNGSPVITAFSPYDVILNSTTDASATNTGALQVVGGVGIGKSLVVGEQLFVPNLSASTSTANLNAVVISGGLYADSGMFNTVATVNGAIVITTATIGSYAFNGGTINSPIVINSATQALSTITGAFQIVNGGAGIGGNVYVGQTLYVAGTSTFFNTATFKTISVGTATITTATVTSAIANTASQAGNALQVVGGGSFGYLRVANAAWVNGSPVITAANINSFSGGTINNQLTINDPTQSISTVTGAFRVTNGGVGIGGNVWSGGSLNTIDTTGSVNGFFGANGANTALQLGTNATNNPVDIIVNNVAVARHGTTDRGLTVGSNYDPIYGVDVLTPTNPTWASSTVSNLLSLRSSLWSDLYSADKPRLSFGVTSNDLGSSFAHWIVSGEQAAGTAQPLVFGGGTWADSNDIATNTAVEWARFTATGNFQVVNNVVVTSNNVSTATIAGNSVQVTGGIGARKLYLSENGWIQGSPIITAATIASYQFNGGTITTPLYVNTNTAAVNATSGAIRTAGGISAVGNMYAGQNLYGSGVIVTNVTATNINPRGNDLTVVGATTFSTSTTATQSGGAITGGGVVVTGGIGVVQNLMVASSLGSTSSIASNAIQAINGGIGAKTLFLEQDGWINGSPIVTAQTLNSFSGGTIANQLYLSNTTEAISTQTGALRVEGGVGIGKNLFVGGNAYVTGDLYIDGTNFIVDTTSIRTGDKVIYVSSASGTAALAVNSGIAVGNTVSPWISFLFNGVNAWQSAGNLIPNSAGGWSLGDSTTPWNTLYSINGRITGATDSTTTATGALQVVGGVGIGKQLTVGSSATILSAGFNLTTSSYNALSVTGGIGGDYLTINKSGYINGSQIITVANIGSYAYDGGIINKAIVENTTTDATSLTTGSIVTAGGVAITKQLQVGFTATIASSAYSTSTIANNALQVTGGIGARSIYLTTEGWINGSPIVTAATINSFSGGTINSQLIINNSTQATSTTTGALQVVNGGLGIGGNIWSGGTGNFGVTSNLPGTLGTTGSGSLTVLGGASVSGLLNVGNSAYFAGNVGVQTPTPGVAFEVNGNVVVGSYNSSRVQITNGGGTNSIYEISTTESNPRWTIGKDLLGIGSAGIGFMLANNTLAVGGAAVGASGASGASSLGFYTSNGTSLTQRGVIDGGTTGGNLGIGLTSGLQGRLHVQGASATGYGIYARGAQEHVFLSNASGNYSDIQITRTTSGVGALADIRIGAAGGAGNFLSTAAQGDAVITYGQSLIFGQQSNFELARMSGTGFSISTATSSISSQSGALTVVGGAGIQGNLYVGGLFSTTSVAYVQSSIASTSTKAGNALVVQGGIGAASLWLDNSGWVNGYQIVTTQNIGALTGAFNGGTITNPLYINNNTDSGSTSSGALYTTGGVGITKQLYVGGLTTLAGAANISGITTHINATQSTTTGTGAVVITNGGLGVGGNISSGGNINFNSATDGSLGKIKWNTVQLMVRDDAGGGAASIFLNGGNSTLPSSSSVNSVYIGGWAAPTATGAANTMVGNSAGYALSSGANNVAVGNGALYYLASGSGNTAVGSGAGGGSGSTAPSQATAFGYQALYVATGARNVALGYQAGSSISSGANNVVIGGNNGSTIATSNNNVIISDGTGNIVFSADSTQAVTVPGITKFTNITSATSTLTGAVQITGGLGVQGDIYARNIYANGTLVGTGGSGGSGGSGTYTTYYSITSATIATSSSTGALIVTGGVGIGKDLFVDGPIVVGSQAYSDTSASLQIEGNAEISGALVAGNHYSQSANLLLYSSDYTQANWSKFNVTNQAGSIISPDGTLNASKLVETAASGAHYYQQTISQTGPVTVSAYFKAGERSYAAINVTVAGQAHAVWFNLSAGTVGTVQASLYNTSGRIEALNYNVATGWYRCSVTVVAPQSASATAVGVYAALGTDSSITGTLTSYTGTSGNGLYVFGLQAEPGYYPGDYNATTSAALAATGHTYVGGSLYVANTGTIGGFPIVNSNTLMSYWGGTSGNTLTMTNTTNSTSTTTGALVVNGGVGVGQDVWIGGTLYATAKSFLINHPSKKGYKLQYGSLEGPENGVYVRGRLKDNNTIELPDYWVDLVDEDSITVDLTPVGKHQKLYVKEIADNKVVVGNENVLNRAIDCFYVVWAERKDIGKLKVERKE